MPVTMPRMLSTVRTHTVVYMVNVLQLENVKRFIFLAFELMFEGFMRFSAVRRLG